MTSGRGGTAPDMGDAVGLVAHDHERMSRFAAAAMSLAPAETEDELLKRTVHAARSLGQADYATITLHEDGAEGGSVLWAGYAGAAVGASLERELRVRDRPYATLRIVTSRSRFEPGDEALVELLCLHAELGLERTALRGHHDVLEQVRTLVRDERTARRDASTVRTVGDLRLDLLRLEVFVAGTPVHLTPSEFRLLELLSEEPGRVYTRHEIAARLWDSELVGSPRVADSHVARLRGKIERDPRHPERLLHVRGVGYKLEPHPRRAARRVPGGGSQ